LKSYKQLPVNFYHIQTKFRDEVRPRFGVMRSREFIMKDAYSFDADKAGMLKSYQAMYDAYLAFEVAPFVQDHCQTQGIAITTTGSSLGAYHAANTLLKHPDRFRRCLALSGVYDIRRFMDGDYDDNFYFNNPVDYMAGLSDPWYIESLRGCDIRLVTGHGPWEDSGPTYRLAEILRGKGIPCSVDDWGADGGHDWPYWKRQMNEYVGRLYP